MCVLPAESSSARGVQPATFKAFEQSKALFVGVPSMAALGSHLTAQHADMLEVRVLWAWDSRIFLGILVYSHPVISSHLGLARSMMAL